MNNAKRIKFSCLLFVMALILIIDNPFLSNFVVYGDKYHSNFKPNLKSAEEEKSFQKWFDARFRYRKNITIHSSKVISDLINFPVLIELYDADLKQAIQANANDVMFTDESGRKLDVEIEEYDQNYNSTHSHLVAWVNTNLSCTYNTVLTMYYGASSLDNQENSRDVWDEGFVGVWHLSETTLPRYDSTNNMLDASPQNYDNDEALNGKIGGADNFDGIDDYIETYKVPSELGLGGKEPKTVSAWVKTISFNGGGICEFGKPEASNAYFSLGTLLTDNEWRGNWGGTKLNDFTCDSLNNWIYFSVVYDGNKNIKIYVNNNIQVNENNTKLNILDDLTLKIGKWGDNSFNGIIDEVRVSRLTRSEGWIKTEYNNQVDPESFYIVGCPEIDENPPRLIDFGINTHNEALIFFSDLTDDLTIVKNVTIRINGSDYEMMQNTSGFWIYQYPIAKYGDYFTYQIVNASDCFGNHLTKSSMEKNFTYTIDLSPPRVNDAYFILNDEKYPSNLTFFAEIEENDSGIEEILLSYYFEELNYNDNLGGMGSILWQEEETSWINTKMKFLEKSDQYHIYVVTVPFPQKDNTSWKVIYRISTIDYSGNVDENAFSVDSKQAENNIISFLPIILISNSSNSNRSNIPVFLDLPPPIVYLSLIILVLGVIITSSVYIKFFQKPVLIGLNKNLVLKNVEKVSNSKLKTSLNEHTLGIVVSTFDQKVGPVPSLAVPISLDIDSNMLLKLSFRAFNNCELVDNFNEVKESVFNFTYPYSNQKISLKSLSYSFSLYRPGSRNDAENITLSILIFPDFFPIVTLFTDRYSSQLKKIHKLLDKHPNDKQ
ncbi:MAG: LamG-like jellyroll fold domain-containing protein, partial [Candidatus Thorarchaeota archaeon]